jgi:hypothetical protein
MVVMPPDLATAQSYSPRRQRRLRARRIVLDPINRLPRQPGLFGDRGDGHRLLPQQIADLEELVAAEAWLAAEVGAIVILLGMLDAGSLSGFGRFGLRPEPSRP